MSPPVAVVAIDVGNSKTDVALVSEGGEVLAAVHGPTASHQQVGEEGMRSTVRLLAAAASAGAGIDSSGGPIAGLVACSAAGADYSRDVAVIRRGLRALGLASDILVVNDCHGGLRAGTDRTWGVCVICGSGMNCLGVAPDGRTARFDSLGSMSGDRGGGGDVGLEGLAAAVRSQDGRGGPTMLARLVPAHFGVARPRDLTRAMYRGAIPFRRHREIAPLVFEAAGEGDPVARAIVDRQADEIVAWAAAAIRRARLARLDPDVVLAGGIFRATDPAFYDRIEAGIGRVAPAARVVRLTAPPVVGAALLGLDRLSGKRTDAAVERCVREGLTHARLEAGTVAAV